MAQGQTPSPPPFNTITWDGVPWELTRQLGRGKFAVVYEIVRSVQPHDKLAAKVINTEPMGVWARGQLKTEVELWGELSHPNVCRLHGSLVLGKYHVLIMDLQRGGELFEAIIERESFLEREASRLMRQLLSALVHLHDRGIIHRDIKPENLLLDSSADSPHLRIADFGAAKRIAHSAGAPSSMPLYATTPCGSLGYAAPEQVRQQLYERQCDLWSAGVVAYVLLSGCMPFDPSNYTASTFELTFPGTLWQGISPIAQDFIRSLLQIDPQLRASAHSALAHPWLTTTAPLPTPLSTPRQLQILRSSGVLEDMFIHANDVWMFCAATTPVDSLSRGAKRARGTVDLSMLPVPEGRPTGAGTLQAVFSMEEPEVPILALPTHVHKRLKK